MAEFDVEVVGAEKPRKRRERIGPGPARAWRGMRWLLLRPRLLVAAGFAGFVLFVGTPHVGWDYECRNPMRSGEPCRSVVYCAYYGIQGRRVEFPEYGESCKLVTFLPVDWRRIF